MLNAIVTHVLLDSFTVEWRSIVASCVAFHKLKKRGSFLELQLRLMLMKLSRLLGIESKHQ